VIRAAVIGFPVKHSRSPLIQGYWLQEHRIAGSYVRHEVKPEAIGRFLSEFAQSGFAGCNVTLPHKEAAFRALKQPEPVARALGAANTIWLEGGELAGTNTDAYGFLAHLDATLPQALARTNHALVLGAGGAARAVVYALHQRGVGRITIVNRSAERTARLVHDLGIAAHVAGFDGLGPLLAETDLLVNTTSLGMASQPPLAIDLAPLKEGAAVYDLVYVPLETPLLRAARARGHPAVDGLGMLLHQAVPGFERWFGVRPEVTETLRARIVADLEGRQS
jgi:shikimate dehydrogenase